MDGRGGGRAARKEDGEKKGVSQQISDVGDLRVGIGEMAGGEVDWVE